MCQRRHRKNPCCSYIRKFVQNLRNFIGRMSYSFSYSKAFCGKWVLFHLWDGQIVRIQINHVSLQEKCTLERHAKFFSQMVHTESRIVSIFFPSETRRDFKILSYSTIPVQSSFTWIPVRSSPFSQLSGWIRWRRLTLWCCMVATDITQSILPRTLYEVGSFRRL